jgi:hypothetical protein
MRPRALSAAPLVALLLLIAAIALAASPKGFVVYLPKLPQFCGDDTLFA